MATVKEEYVSFEIAKLLKEKGFDEGCRACYGSAGSFCYKKYEIEASECEIHNYLLAPTLQMAMCWLRKKGIAVVPILSSVLDNERFLWDIEITVAKTNETYHQGWIYESPEQACEAAIKYCLEHLI